MINYLIFVSGRVQGVGFRYATLLLARQYHLTGTVENLPMAKLKSTSKARPVTSKPLSSPLRLALIRIAGWRKSTSNPNPWQSGGLLKLPISNKSSNLGVNRV